MKKNSAAGAALIEDLVARSRILAQHGVLDAYGHISDKRPDPFIMSRTWARPLVGAPVWDIRQVKADNDVLVRDRPLGAALASTLGSCTCVLMRGHGMAVVGDSIQEAVYLH